jgi:hypothetical protein
MVTDADATVLHLCGSIRPGRSCATSARRAALEQLLDPMSHRPLSAQCQAGKGSVRLLSDNPGVTTNVHMYKSRKRSDQIRRLSSDTNIISYNYQTQEKQAPISGWAPCDITPDTMLSVSVAINTLP